VIPKKRRAAEHRAARRQGSSHHQLNSFWAVAEEGSFSGKAAEHTSLKSGAYPGRTAHMALHLT